MPFSDPITAGDVLVRNAIQSDNFVTGISGWRVQRTGNAEFNDLTVRGAFTTLTSFQFVIPGNSGRTSFSFQEWQTGPDRDAFGIFMVGEAGDHVNLILREDAGGFGEIVVNQEIVAGDPTDSADLPASETWHAVTFQNGWSNTGGNWSPVAYRLMPDGTVRFRGLMTAGTKTNGTQVFNTLPSFYRPAFDQHLDLSSDVVGNTPVLQVLTTGVCTINHMGTANIVSLDSMTYPLGVI